MANVKEITNRLVNEEEGLISSCVGMMNIEGIKSMDLKELELLKSSFKLMDTFNELMVAYAEVINEMNAKLDRIVNEQEKRA